MHIQDNNSYQLLWEKRSSVRTRPRKIIDFSAAGYFFPEFKQALLHNGKTLSLCKEQKEQILLQTFKKYLQDIVNLEIKLIANACNLIIEGNLVFTCSNFLRLNAQTILIDEYYHVYIAQDILIQIENAYPSLGSIEYNEPDSCMAVKTVKNSLNEVYHDVFDIIAVCIFETTLVRELIEYFNTSSLNPSVQCYVNDHMNDESRHFGFFKHLLEDIWVKIPESYREAIGGCLADFIVMYLNVNSERKFNSNLLNTIIEDIEKSSALVDGIYMGFAITMDLPIVKNVLKVLRETGILKHNAVVRGFSSIGWELEATIAA